MKLNKKCIIDFFKGNTYIVKIKLAESTLDLAVNNIKSVYIDLDVDNCLVIELHGDESSSQECVRIFKRELKSLMNSKIYSNSFYISKLIINK